MLLTKITKDETSDIFFNTAKLDKAFNLNLEILEKASPFDQTDENYFRTIDLALLNVPKEIHNQLPLRFLYALSKRESNNMLDIMSDYGKLNDFSKLESYLVKLYCLSFMHYHEYIHIDPSIERNTPNKYFYQSQKNLIKYFIKNEAGSIRDPKTKKILYAAVMLMIKKNTDELQLTQYDEAQISFLNYLNSRKTRENLIFKLMYIEANAGSYRLEYVFDQLEKKLKEFLEKHKLD